MRVDDGELQGGFTSNAGLRDKQEESWPFSCPSFSLSHLQRARQTQSGAAV
jgi:hypothetical protein